ncbi:hypothetical protein [Amycolatopsis sp. WAC 04182]|uniref:hypothetical protein n=1 Tax=Amycolatopsis sp. WAC 04182 TaxID=2203198 RepID=UPI000F786ADB|nr:hypothetical protein [Amycolatopsis sp. WAC 04182]
MSGVARCPRGHALVGYNALPHEDCSRNGGCRACMAAFQWARRNSRFNDDPRTVAHADRLFASYQEVKGGNR